MTVFISKRVKKLKSNHIKSWIISIFSIVLTLGAIANAAVEPEKMLRLDMVHHNPGEAQFDSQFNDPKLMKEMGYNGKVFFLFDSATLAINWQKYDKEIAISAEEQKWVDDKRAEINAKYNEAKAAGLKIYCMSDLILLPKSVIKHYGVDKTFGDVSNEKTQELLRAQLRLMFGQFPQLDGIVVRIGETYLHNAPFHKGSIKDKTDADKTIIPLMQILREEVCVKLGKQVAFRTWWSFDVDLNTYMAVSNGVEPHENLYISVKHCEGDFQRGNRFSKVLGAGRHKQIVEVQCQREYSGKGAYPHYIANGVINGFEEYKYMMSPDEMQSVAEVAKTENFAGLWTWSRGGGWGGPYLTRGYSEIWCKLNAAVMVGWAQDTSRSEEEIFNEFASKELGLKGDDLKRFRKLALLSADAVVRGKRDIRSKMTCWWTRDQTLGKPPIDYKWSKEDRDFVIEQKHESDRIWSKIVVLADKINFPDPGYGKAVRLSCRYGQRLYHISRLGFDIANLADNIDGNRDRIKGLIAEYDKAWQDYIQLKADNPECPSLYNTPDKENGNNSMAGYINSIREKM